MTQLKDALEPETTLGVSTAVVQGYVASLIGMVYPYLDKTELELADAPDGAEPSQVPEIVQAGQLTPDGPDDVWSAVAAAQSLTALAPTDRSIGSRAEWAAGLVGWTAGATGGAGLGAGLAADLNLSWLPPDWVAVVGAIVGIAGA